MLKLGAYNTLEIVRERKPGLFLEDEDFLRIAVLLSDIFGYEGLMCVGMKLASLK